MLYHDHIIDNDTIEDFGASINFLLYTKTELIELVIDAQEGPFKEQLKGATKVSWCNYTL